MSYNLRSSRRAVSLSRWSAATLGCAGLVIGVADAATAAGHTAHAKAGKITVYAVSTSPTTSPGKIIVTGAFGDHGSLRGTGATTDRVRLAHGSFDVDTAALDNGKVTNEKSCEALYKASGRVMLSDGTGAYTGIHGSLKVTLVDIAVGPRKNGKCNTSKSALPVASEEWVTGSGTASFSG